MISPIASSSAFTRLELFEAPRRGMQRAFALAHDAVHRTASGEVTPKT
jgi:hypothetical protein